MGSISHGGARARGHGAMMPSVAAAAGRQARIIVAGWKGGRKRPEPEEQNQVYGEQAPHLGFILHEDWNLGGKGGLRSGIIGASRCLSKDKRESLCLKEISL
jgi:hypothetical protein